MWKSVFADRRVWLLGLILVLVGVLTRWSVTADTGFRWVVTGGYWATLFLVVMFGRAIWPTVCARCKAAEFGRFDACVLAGVMLIVGVWIAQERPGYKILADELVMSGTAMGLHYERLAACPTRATDVQGSFQMLDRAIDKRPLLFPFFVASVHDLTGYRPENAFYLNMALAVVFLCLVYLIGWNMAGTRWAGVVIVLLFAGLPLMAQQATGGGFELLNLLLIAGFVLLTIYYLEKPEAGRLEALVFGGLLLASTRYESVIFLVPVAIAAVLGWWRSRQVLLSWPLVWSPVFLVPWLLQNRLFSEHSAAWQMHSLKGATEPFGLQYFGSNLGHALAYFFDFTGYATNSPVFALLGLLGVPLLGLWILHTVKASSKANGVELGTALVGISLFGSTALYLLYFWGQFDDPIISRLSLPVHLLFAVAVVKAVSLVSKKQAVWKGVALVALGGLLLHGLPVMARQAYRTNYNPGVEMQMREDFFLRLRDTNVLFLDNDSYFWILRKIPASPVTGIDARKQGLIYHLRNHSFQDMYVFQSVFVDEKTGNQSVDPVDDLGPGYELETVMEKRVQPLLFARISRIIAIKDGEATTVRPKPFVEALDEKRTPAELERSRSLYMENWIRQLP